MTSFNLPYLYPPNLGSP